MIKKKLLPAIIAIALMATTFVSAYAISAELKARNAFQLAASVDDIASVEAEEDFRYTHFNSENLYPAQEDQGNVESAVEYGNTPQIFSDENLIPGGEDVSADPKINLYNKMLNSIDYFNNLSLTMETSMLSDDTTTVEYQIDINSNVAYQAVSEGEQIESETYSEAENMILVNNTARTYMQNYLPTYARSDTPYIPLESRITTGDDGIPCYSYRRNVTNCPLASYSVFPQEITYSYLKDFDKWEIEDDDVTYLGRSCIKIVGIPSPYIAEKHNIDSFTMLVDSDTGILLDFQGTLNGNVSRYMTVTECIFESRAVVKQFDLANYDGYSEVQR